MVINEWNPCLLLKGNFVVVDLGTVDSEYVSESYDYSGSTAVEILESFYYIGEMLFITSGDAAPKLKKYRAIFSKHLSWKCAVKEKNSKMQVKCIIKMLGHY